MFLFSFSCLAIKYSGQLLQVSFFKICITKIKHLLFHRKICHINKYRIALEFIDYKVKFTLHLLDNIRKC